MRGRKTVVACVVVRQINAFGCLSGLVQKDWFGSVCFKMTKLEVAMGLDTPFGDSLGDGHA